MRNPLYVRLIEHPVGRNTPRRPLGVRGSSTPPLPTSRLLPRVCDVKIGARYFECFNEAVIAPGLVRPAGVPPD